MAAPRSGCVLACTRDQLHRNAAYVRFLKSPVGRTSLSNALRSRSGAGSGVPGRAMPPTLQSLHSPMSLDLSPCDVLPISGDRTTFAVAWPLHPLTKLTSPYPRVGRDRSSR